MIHEQNSVPGRSNVLFSKRARCVATTFKVTASFFRSCRTERTGLPVRRELRSAPRPEKPAVPRILVTGGSQGAAALNQAALETASRAASEGWSWLHLTGKAHYEAVLHTCQAFALGSRYAVKDYVEGAELAEAFAGSTLAVCRSGAGTLSELAAFRLPSVLVPYPLAFANHQFHNASEFEEIGAAVVVPQAELSSSTLETAIKRWLSDPEAMARAQAALERWDAPDAAERILAIVCEAASPAQRA